MFDQITEQLPLFFNYHNLVFLLQAAGRTLAMTVIGCTVGFVCGFLIAVVTCQLLIFKKLKWF